jgi:SAM-dependent methyltransferase
MLQPINTTGKIAAVRSPLSALPPKKIRDLPKPFLLEQLGLLYQAKPPPQIVEGDYSLWECAETGLQFAWPMLPGNIAFYEWVSQFTSYYPGLRWEYKKVRELLKTENAGKKLKLLDAGCGKGDFLRGLDFIPNDEKTALDLNAPAIEECKRHGFQAFCGTVETAIATNFLKPAAFSAVTSFHCLEHVSEPVEFVRDLLKITAPGGRIFVSTPYSPMSTEAGYFDVLNHPPHHLTRWNLKAYQKLADILGVKMRYYVPPGGALKKALKAFWLSQNAPNQPIRKVKLLADLTRRFPVFFRHYQKQSELERNHQGVGADVILVEFALI